MKRVWMSPHWHESAANPLAKWRFEPAVLGGKLIPVYILVEMSFCLY